MRIILGTAQLGMKYGIIGPKAPTADRARSVIHAAVVVGIQSFDTAQGYGASEQFLGESLDAEGVLERSEIITKITLRARDSARIIFETALESTKRIGKPPDSLLAHNEDIVWEWSSDLSREVEAARKQGAFGRFGVSVYSPEAALEAAKIDSIELIQVPANAFDHRLEDVGFWELCASRRAEVVVRSIYLQGLPFLASEQIARRFPAATNAMDAFDRWFQTTGRDKDEVLVRYVMDRWGASPVVGCDHANHVHRLSAIASSPPLTNEQQEEWRQLCPPSDEAFLDPRKWN